LPGLVHDYADKALQIWLRDGDISDHQVGVGILLA